jgi:catechol 2,3-dioxygenase-like lactoylglutathione lyase family enzyme
VTDLDRSIDFYRDVLGLALRAQWPEGAYLEAGSLWLCLSIDEQIGDMARGDCTHIAFDVAEGDFAQLGEHIRSAAKIWKNNRSEGQSLYFLDPVATNWSCTSGRWHRAWRIIGPIPSRA